MHVYIYCSKSPFTDKQAVNFQIIFVTNNFSPNVIDDR